MEPVPTGVTEGPTPFNATPPADAEAHRLVELMLYCARSVPVAGASAADGALPVYTESVDEPPVTFPRLGVTLLPPPHTSARRLASESESESVPSESGIWKPSAWSVGPMP